MMNQDSSRSHSIFAVTVEMTEKFDAVAAAAAMKAGKKDDDTHIRVGKMNLVGGAGRVGGCSVGAHACMRACACVVCVCACLCVCVFVRACLVVHGPGSTTMHSAQRSMPPCSAPPRISTMRPAHSCLLLSARSNAAQPNSSATLCNSNATPMPRRWILRAVSASPRQAQQVRGCSEPLAQPPHLAFNPAPALCAGWTDMPPCALR